MGNKSTNFKQSLVEKTKSINWNNDEFKELPSFESMAKQLVANGVMSNNSLDAFDRHLPQTMNQTMTMTMTMTMSRVLTIEEDDDEHDFAGIGSVRSHVEWKDYLYVVKFLQNLDKKLPVLKDDQDLEKPSKYQFPVEHYEQNFDEENSSVRDELNELYWKQEHPEREQRIDEIIDEELDYSWRFMNSLGIDPHTHPKTVRLIYTMGFVAACVVLPWKNCYKRPRPSQVDRHITPVINVPAHYSFPSGHATQAYLTFECLKDVIPDEVVPGAHIKHVAEQIAVNREWAGVHYASDTIAGRKLAKTIGDYIKLETTTDFDDLIEQARSEWPTFKLVE